MDVRKMDSSLNVMAEVDTARDIIYLNVEKGMIGVQNRLIISRLPNGAIDIRVARMNIEKILRQA